MEHPSLEERDLRYGSRLAEMIRCRTVSKKDGFEPEEFLKLRKVIETLFPLVTEQAELTVFGDDAYLYKLTGMDKTRNVMVMSHHDVVEATGNWQEEPFGGALKNQRSSASAGDFCVKKKTEEFKSCMPSVYFFLR